MRWSGRGGISVDVRLGRQPRGSISEGSWRQSTRRVWLGRLQDVRRCKTEYWTGGTWTVSRLDNGIIRDKGHLMGNRTKWGALK